MINELVMAQINGLSKKYEETWGKEVDYTVIPPGLSQEKLVKCLELMIESNYSLLVAYNMLYKK